MDNLTGSPLSETLKFLQEKSNKIIKIVKLKGTNSKFNNLSNPYVIKNLESSDYITLYVTYY
ncbi:hypothetical protein JYG23_03610 [Sedimentibacter sp. zth1]|uniref:hypothetical protein n=1 Tax=Sedimentibacter sp. zth1 TaxID=2816908 RepID=UPI001A91F628|nr:hypothetical protein [Sedimentibacter sp. zth1]QSX06555.1 hypothetical protein JYG23_03610 [Sedimentibacter sp. zth1]